MSLTIVIARYLGKKLSFLECVYKVPIEPLMFFWVGICQAIPISVSRYSDSVSW